ncbi:hypothetical protein CSPX01_09762 [Colletotrichum filicis]|nr:hypothetical protein CSPX01_09762 [Colletotrichum filicis]
MADAPRSIAENPATRVSGVGLGSTYLKTPFDFRKYRDRGWELEDHECFRFSRRKIPLFSILRCSVCGHLELS